MLVWHDRSRCWVLPKEVSSCLASLFALALVLQCEAPVLAGADRSLDDIEVELRAHRRLVRMCGPLSAMRMLKSYGHDFDADQTLTAFQAEGTDQGVELGKVVDWCQAFEPAAKAVQLSRLHLDCLPLPCILVVNDDRHCLVLEKLDSKRSVARVWDPSDLRLKEVPLAGLRDAWSGKTIIVGNLRTADWFFVGMQGLVVVALIAALVCFPRCGSKTFSTKPDASPVALDPQPTDWYSPS